MIIANLEEMLKNKIGSEYEYKNHTWLNQKLNCGCIIAICMDVTPSKEDCDYITRLFTKQNTLNQIIKETLNSTDSEIKDRFEEFRNELEETKVKLNNFVILKRDEYKFPVGTDFNGEYYLIKLKQSTECSRN